MTWETRSQGSGPFYSLHSGSMICFRLDCWSALLIVDWLPSTSNRTANKQKWWQPFQWSVCDTIASDVRHWALFENLLFFSVVGCCCCCSCWKWYILISHVCCFAFCRRAMTMAEWRWQMRSCRTWNMNFRVFLECKQRKNISFSSIADRLWCDFFVHSAQIIGGQCSGWMFEITSWKWRCLRWYFDESTINIYWRPRAKHTIFLYFLQQTRIFDSGFFLPRIA